MRSSNEILHAADDVMRVTVRMCAMWRTLMLMRCDGLEVLKLPKSR